LEGFTFKGDTLLASTKIDEKGVFETLFLEVSDFEL
jgi:hypothetical protein